MIDREERFRQRVRGRQTPGDLGSVILRFDVRKMEYLTCSSIYPSTIHDHDHDHDHDSMTTRLGESKSNQSRSAVPGVVLPVNYLLLEFKSKTFSSLAQCSFLNFLFRCSISHQGHSLGCLASVES